MEEMQCMDVFALCFYLFTLLDCDRCEYSLYLRTCGEVQIKKVKSLLDSTALLCLQASHPQSQPTPNQKYSGKKFQKVAKSKLNLLLTGTIYMAFYFIFTIIAWRPLFELNESIQEDVQRVWVTLDQQ